MPETIIKPRRIGRKWDLTGCRFGNLVVIEKATPTVKTTGINGHARWLCLCDCGAQKIIMQSNLLNGHSRRCGCRRGRNSWRHGMSHTRIYVIWQSMKQRCLNPKVSCYPRYGGRGVTVCERWRDSFEAFLNDMGPSYRDGFSIDRIDNNRLGYCKENCRWIPAQEQAGNKRNNRYLSLDGQTHTIAEWSRITSIDYNTIHERLRHGWSVERALSTPCNRNK